MSDHARDLMYVIAIFLPVLGVLAARAVNAAERADRRNGPDLPGSYRAPDPMHVEDPPRCQHHDAVAVDSIVDGSLLAHWCPTCQTQLPAVWRSPRTAPTAGELNARGLANVLASTGVSFSTPATPDDCPDCEWLEEPRRLCDFEPTWHLAQPCPCHRRRRP